MREPDPDSVFDGVFDAVQDPVEDPEGWPISQADGHADQFRSGQPDTAARRKPVVIGQLADRAKHYRRTGTRPLTVLRG